VLDGVQIPTGRGNFGDRGAHCKVWGLSAMSCAKTAELIDLPFGLWTLVDQRKHAFNRQVAPMCLTTICHELCKNGLTDRFFCLDCGLGWVEGHTSSIVFARWCQCALMGGHIASTTELSICSGDATLCQITLTTCYYYNKK